MNPKSCPKCSYETGCWLVFRFCQAVPKRRSKMSENLTHSHSVSLIRKSNSCSPRDSLPLTRVQYYHVTLTRTTTVGVRKTQTVTVTSSGAPAATHKLVALFERRELQGETNHDQATSSQSLARLAADTGTAAELSGYGCLDRRHLCPRCPAAAVGLSKNPGASPCCPQRKTVLRKVTRTKTQWTTSFKTTATIYKTTTMTLATVTVAGKM